MVHINLSSFAGGGKTTTAKLLLETHRTVMIPKVTTRPPRPAEHIPEYIYVSREEFEFRKTLGHFIAVEEVAVNGELHYHAIPKVEHWPRIPGRTELVLSVFGEYAHLAQRAVPEMKLVFVSFMDRSILADRLRRRCLADGSNFNKKWALNKRYFAINIEDQYDFVVYNDTTPEDCVAQITSIMER